MAIPAFWLVERLIPPFWRICGEVWLTWASQGSVWAFWLVSLKMFSTVIGLFCALFSDWSRLNRGMRYQSWYGNVSKKNYSQLLLDCKGSIRSSWLAITFYYASGGLYETVCKRLTRYSEIQVDVRLLRSVREILDAVYRRTHRAISTNFGAEALWCDKYAREDKNKACTATR